METPISPRAEAQNELRDTLVCLGLNDSYGIIDGKGVSKTGKSFRSLTFAKAANLDGVLEIYGPGFIVAKWKTRYQSLPQTGQQNFRSILDVKRFLIQHFFFG